MINPDKIKSISLVIPLYNETRRISKSLPEIEKVLEDIEKNHKISCELILVDDGSADDTSKAVRSLLKLPKSKLISYRKNAGKGFAIKTGFKVAEGNYIFFMDADLSTPLSYIEIFLELAGNEIIIGTRKTNPDLVKVRQSFTRRNLGRGFTVLTNLLLRTSVSDFTCGFKMFPKEMGKNIFNHLTIDRWGFDAEIVYLAKHFGYNIKEVPVLWSNDSETKVKLSKDIYRSLADILNIRYKSFTGVYDN